jgi:DNA-binding Lrp family transcriptional regulator
MSVRVLTKVLKYSQAMHDARLVLMVIADSAHDDGITWISQSTLAEKALVTEQTVRRVIRELEKTGEIQTRKAQRGRRRINVYRVSLPGVEEPEYDDLPFELVEPFTTEDIVRSSNGDDRRSEPVTTEDLGRISAPTPLIGPVRGTVGANAPSENDITEPPKIIKIDGHNKPLDTLCDVCGIDPDSPRHAQAITALNGTRGKPGIRHLFWEECRRFAETQFGGKAMLLGMHEDPGRWAQALERRIRQKAERYVDRFDDAELTPTALQKWWLDLEHAPAGGSRGLTPTEIANMRFEP